MYTLLPSTTSSFKPYNLRGWSHADDPSFTLSPSVFRVRHQFQNIIVSCYFRDPILLCLQLGNLQEYKRLVFADHFSLLRHVVTTLHRIESLQWQRSFPRPTGLKSRLAFEIPLFSFKDELKSKTDKSSITNAKSLMLNAILHNHTQSVIYDHKRCFYFYCY